MPGCNEDVAGKLAATLESFLRLVGGGGSPFDFTGNEGEVADGGLEGEFPMSNSRNVE